MKKYFVEYVKEVALDSNERRVVQHAYFGIATLLVVLAGLVSLASASWGRMVLLAPAFILMIALINAAVWYGIKRLIATWLTSSKDSSKDTKKSDK